MKDSTTGCKVGGLEMEQVTCNCNRVGIALSFIDDRSRGTQSTVVVPLAAKYFELFQIHKALAMYLLVVILIY